MWKEPQVLKNVIFIFVFSWAASHPGLCCCLRGSSSWLRMTCWRIPVMTLLNSSTRVRASTKQPLEITLERGKNENGSFSSGKPLAHILCSDLPTTSLCGWKQHQLATQQFPCCCVPFGPAHTHPFPTAFSPTFRSSSGNVVCCLTV